MFQHGSMLSMVNDLGRSRDYHQLGVNLQDFKQGETDEQLKAIHDYAEEETFEEGTMMIDEVNEESTFGGSDLANQPHIFEHAFSIESIGDTERLASVLAPILKKGDVVLLIGDMGSGKSVFARQVVRCLEQDQKLNVPSPTYLLDNVYHSKINNQSDPVHHIDLYRLDRFDRLDLPSVFTTGISLIEWGNRLLEDEIMSKPHHAFIRESLYNTEKCHVLCVIFDDPKETELSEVEHEEEGTISENENRVIAFQSLDPEWKDRIHALAKQLQK